MRFTREQYERWAVKHGRPAEPQRESDLHALIMDDCRAMGWQFFHGAMSARTHRTLGEPDFIIAADGGRVLWVECKRRGQKLSPEQRAVEAGLRVNGHVLHVVHDWEEWSIVKALV